MEPFTRQDETVADTIVGTRLRRGPRVEMILVLVALAVVLGFWAVMYWVSSGLGSETGMSGYLQNVPMLDDQSGARVVISSGGAVVATVDASMNGREEPTFSVQLEPGDYHVDVTLADGSPCSPRRVTVPDRGYAEVAIDCRVTNATP